jgi:hypothetical protein
MKSEDAIWGSREKMFFFLSWLFKYAVGTETVQRRKTGWSVNVELLSQWELAVETKVLEENLPHRKSHITWPGVDPLWVSVFDIVLRAWDVNTTFPPSDYAILRLSVATSTHNGEVISSSLRFSYPKLRTGFRLFFFFWGGGSSPKVFKGHKLQCLSDYYKPRFTLTPNLTLWKFEKINNRTNI